MEIFILLVILLLCIGAAALKGDSTNRRAPTLEREYTTRGLVLPTLPPPDQTPTPSGYRYTVPEINLPYPPTGQPSTSVEPFRRTSPEQPFRQRRIRERDRETATMIENWKKSIAGLVKLSDKNLTNAKSSFEIKAYRVAVEFARTSLENISRALIHCHGGKPYDERGQEEALRMLLSRFDGQRKTEFEKAIESLDDLGAQINSYLTAQSLDEATGERILDSAKELTVLFKRMLIDYFAVEIAELTEEACPKCLTSDVSVWSFDPEKVHYECNGCHFKWNDPQI